MPVYVYRREDGTTFEVRQSFSDAPLTVDPSTGQKVARIVQNAGVIFKGSGFYVNDSKSASKQTLTNTSSNHSSTETASTESSTSTETKTETKSEKSTEAAPVTQTSSTTTTAAAAD